MPIFFFLACESLSSGETVPLFISAKLETSFSYILFFVLQIEYFLFFALGCAKSFFHWRARKKGNRNRKIKTNLFFVYFFGKEMFADVKMFLSVTKNETESCITQKPTANVQSFPACPLKYSAPVRKPFSQKRQSRKKVSNG